MHSRCPVKCVALDLDNTCWPGVLLEHDSSSAAAPSPPWPTAFAKLHAVALKLHARGVLLVSCSRNDESPVMAAWPPPDRCALQPSHFVAHLFGWGPKSVRLGDFMATVGLAHEAVIFIDDRAEERAEVRAALPQLCVCGAGILEAVKILEEEEEVRRQRNGAGISADAASRTEKTRALLARAAAAAAHTEDSADLAVDSKNSRSARATGGSRPKSKGARISDVGSIKPRAGRRHKGADKRRRRAAKKAGAAERVPGTGGGYATVGGYPESFLRTLELKLVLTRCHGRGSGDHDVQRSGGRMHTAAATAADLRLLARAAELVARTTQFNIAEPRHEADARDVLENLLLRRREPSQPEQQQLDRRVNCTTSNITECDAHERSVGGQVWLMRASDRFGDHGVVGVIALEYSASPHTSMHPAAAEVPLHRDTDLEFTQNVSSSRRFSESKYSHTPIERRPPPRAHVVMFSVSCRVLALEPAPVFLAEVLRRSGVEAPIGARVAITDRNMPCRTVFRDAGFVPMSRDCCEASWDHRTEATSSCENGRDCTADMHTASKQQRCHRDLAAPLAGDEQWSTWVLHDLAALPDADPSTYNVVVE